MLEVDHQNTSLGSEVAGRLWVVAEELVLMMNVEELEAKVNLSSQSTVNCRLNRPIGRLSNGSATLAGLRLAPRL